MDSRTMHTVEITKDVIVLLDIDKTLIVYKDYTLSEQIIYTGGLEHWKEGLRHFKATAEKAGVRVHYGLATFKPKSLLPELTGDIIYGRLMKDLNWANYSKCNYSNNDIKEFIHPKLIFFLGEKLKDLATHITEAHKQELLIDRRPPAFKPTMTAADTIYFSEEFYQCKARYAMAEAAKVIEAEFKTTVPAHHVYLIDDVPEVCHGCTQLGYSSICVHTLAQAPEDHQQQVIKLIFYNLLIEQVTHDGTPKDVHDNLMAANKVVLDILQTPKDVSKTLRILEDTTKRDSDENLAERKNQHRFFSNNHETEAVEEKPVPIITAPSPLPSPSKTD